MHYIFKLKTILIILLILIIIFIVLFITKNISNNEQESTTIIETESVTQEDLIISENGIDYQCKNTPGYTAMIAIDNKKIITKDSLQKYASVRGLSLTKKGNTKIGFDLIGYTIDPLFEDEHIINIEYLLENCVGTINGNLTYEISSEFQAKSIPYSINPAQQKEIYICLYVNYGSDSASFNDKLKIVSEIMNNAIIKIKLKYDNGNEEIRYIGFKQYNESSYKDFVICNLTLEN